MKFKVGDRVANIKNTENSNYNRYLGNKGTIIKVKEQLCLFPYIVKFDNEILGQDMFKDEELKLVQSKQFTLNDLKERYIVTYRNGEEAVYVKVINITTGNAWGYNFSLIKNGKSLGIFRNIENYNNDLTNKYNKDYDIISICKPKYETVWTREEEPIKEMTVAEIEKELGYTIKVIK